VHICLFNDVNAISTRIESDIEILING